MPENNKITIITSFFNIGREHIKGFERDNKKYLEYFSFWAGLQNELIVYTSKEFEKDIMNERKKHHLEHKTKIIIKNLEDFEPATLTLMRKTFKEFNQSKNRANAENIECVSANYCFLMYMKVLCACDVISKGLGAENLLWLDFGFNHGKDFFTDKTQFNFTLQNSDKMAKDKMNFFKLKDKEDENIARLYFTMQPFIIGGLLFGSKNAWLKFHGHYQKGIECFASMGIMDDDQLFLLWCARNYPKHYALHRCYAWFDYLCAFMPENTAKNLSINSKTAALYKLIKKEFKENLKAKNYFRTLKNLAQYFYYKFIYKKTF